MTPVPKPRPRRDPARTTAQRTRPKPSEPAVSTLRLATTYADYIRVTPRT